MSTLDSSIVNIALPTLTKELGVDLYRVKWVVIIYLLVLTCLLLPFGRFSDDRGRKQIFQIGFLVFTLGSAICGFAPGLGWLVVGRAVQGIGSAMLMVNGPAIITAAFPANERGAALGTLAMVVSLGLISGPSLGGLLISTLGWKSIFWVNLPIGVLGILMVSKFVARDHPSRRKVPFDWMGAFLQTLALLSFMMVFDPPQVSISGSTPVMPPRWLMAGLTGVLFFLFIRFETWATAPLFDLSLMKNKTFWTGNLASFLTFVSFSSVTVLMPFFLEELMKFPPAKAGIFMTAIPLTIFVSAPIAGRLSDRLGGQELSFGGALVSALAMMLMAGVVGSGLSADMSPTGIVLVLMLIGLAMGLFQSPNNNAIMGSVPAGKLGAASALLATIRNLGMVTGTGLATGIFHWRMSVTGEFLASMHLSHFVAGLISVGAMVASLGKERGPVREI